MGKREELKALVEKALRAGEDVLSIEMRLHVSRAYVQNIQHYIKEEGRLTAIAAEVMENADGQKDKSDDRVNPLSNMENRMEKSEPTQDAAVVDHIFALYDKKLLSQKETVALIKRGAIA